MLSRNLYLDVLRGIAVILVLFRHATLPPMPDGWEKSLLDSLNGGGWCGVDLFFVLSGFLVSMLLFKEYQRSNTVRLGRFFMRRGWKIYPMFWLFILATVLVLTFHPGQRKPETPKLMAELLFYQNYTPGLWAHTWSLAVEEHFYLLVGIGLTALLAFPLRGRRGLHAVPWICLGGMALLTAVRVMHSLWTPYDHYTHLFPTHLRIDSLLMGVLISYLWCFHREAFLAHVTRWRWPLAVMGLLLFAHPFVFLEPWRTWWQSSLGLTALYLGAGMIVAVTLSLPDVRQPLIRWPLLFVAMAGVSSYAIYLWHMPWKVWGPTYLQKAMGIRRPVQLGPEDAFWFFIFGSLLLGILLTLLVEQPLLLLRNKLFPSIPRQKDAAPSPPTREDQILTAEGNPT
ncbi:MAG: acyltransferase [Terrimicrobiaceae bacterium]|nr:acyltransferase [Terrimicrobiaceae bacterium]